MPTKRERPNPKQHQYLQHPSENTKWRGESQAAERLKVSEAERSSAFQEQPQEASRCQSPSAERIMENLQLNFLARKRDLWGNSQCKQLYEKKKNHRVPNSSTMKNLEGSRNNVGSNPCPFQVTVSRLICGWQLHLSIYSDTCYVRP